MTTQFFPKIPIPSPQPWPTGGVSQRDIDRIRSLQALQRARAGIAAQQKEAEEESAARQINIGRAQISPSPQKSWLQDLMSNLPGGRAAAFLPPQASGIIEGIQRTPMPVRERLESGWGALLDLQAGGAAGLPPIPGLPAIRTPLQSGITQRMEDIGQRLDDTWAGRILPGSFRMPGYSDPRTPEAEARRQRIQPVMDQYNSGQIGFWEAQQEARKIQEELPFLEQITGEMTSPFGVIENIIPVSWLGKGGKLLSRGIDAITGLRRAPTTPVPPIPGKLVAGRDFVEEAVPSPAAVPDVVEEAVIPPVPGARVAPVVTTPEEGQTLLAGIKSKWEQRGVKKKNIKLALLDMDELDTYGINTQAARVELTAYNALNQENFASGIVINVLVNLFDI